MPETPRQLSPLPRTSRRAFLRTLAASGATLAGCGGGGSDAGAGATGVPTGSLVYRNNSVAAVWSFATGAKLEFDAGNAFVDPGMSASPGGVVMAALDGDNGGFDIAQFDLLGQPLEPWRLARPFAFLTGAPMFNSAGTRVAFSVDEPVSGSNNTRIARTLVLRWPDRTLLGTLDRWEVPVWAGAELVVRDPQDQTLHLFGDQLQSLGPLAGLVTEEGFATYHASANGRHVVWSDGPRLHALDRQTGDGWVAAERSVARLSAPCFSPDGRWLALHTLDDRSANPFFWTVTPHVLPFSPGTTVTVQSAQHALADSLAECGNRIAWVA